MGNVVAQRYTVQIYITVDARDDTEAEAIAEGVVEAMTPEMNALAFGPIVTRAWEKSFTRQEEQSERERAEGVG
jgi:hypothetical protein